MDPFDWLEQLEEKGPVLTIESLLKLPRGQWFPVMSLHRNVLDVVENRLRTDPPLGLLPANEFFAEHKSPVRVAETGPRLMLDIRWSEADGSEADVVVPHVLLARADLWVPLENGRLSDENARLAGFGWPRRVLLGGVSWRDLPPETPVGFRGP